MKCQKRGQDVYECIKCNYQLCKECTDDDGQFVDNIDDESFIMTGGNEAKDVIQQVRDFNLMTAIKLKGVIIYTSEEFEYLNEKENK